MALLAGSRRGFVIALSHRCRFYFQPIWMHLIWLIFLFTRGGSPMRVLPHFGGWKASSSVDARKGVTPTRYSSNGVLRKWQPRNFRKNLAKKKKRFTIIHSHLITHAETTFSLHPTGHDQESRSSSQGDKRWLISLWARGC